MKEIGMETGIIRQTGTEILHEETTAQTRHEGTLTLHGEISIIVPITAIPGTGLTLTRVGVTLVTLHGITITPTGTITTISQGIGITGPTLTI